MNPNDCPFFKPSATAAWICYRWITPDSGPRAVSQFEPFCAADFECEGKGIRHPLEFVNINGEMIMAPKGCDGLCRINCEVHDPQHAFCMEQVCGDPKGVSNGRNP